MGVAVTLGSLMSISSLQVVLVCFSFSALLFVAVNAMGAGAGQGRPLLGADLLVRPEGERDSTVLRGRKGISGMKNVSA